MRATFHKIQQPLVVLCKKGLIPTRGCNRCSVKVTINLRADVFLFSWNFVNQIYLNIDKHTHRCQYLRRKIRHVMEAMAIFTSLDDMRRNVQLCDAVLEVEGRQFPVHRVILAANSLYFRALFTNGMHETSENVIKIPSVSPELMERILEYAYSRDTTITEQNVGKLLPVADQFNFRGEFKNKEEFCMLHL